MKNIKATLKIEIEFDYEKILKQARVWNDKSYNYKDNNSLLADYLINDSPITDMKVGTIKDIELTKEKNENWKETNTKKCS